MSKRKDRVKALKDAMTDYVKKEKTRIEDEVAMMQAILDGRGGGGNAGKKAVEAVAFDDLASYLGEG